MDGNVTWGKHLGNMDTDRDAKTVVVRHGPDFEVLAANVLDDGFDASAAIVGDEIYLRGQRNLYCIARD